MEKAPWLDKDEDFFHFEAVGECIYCLKEEKELNLDKTCEKCFYKLQEGTERIYGISDY
jgi:hypothetical protein